KRTWKATDACGNASTCVQTITVQDITAPVAANSSFQVVTSPCTTTVPADATATATDACDSAPVITSSDVLLPGSCAGNYVIKRTWKAADACGNASTCVQTIIVQDTVAPVADNSSLDAVTAQCTATLPSAPTAT